MNKAIAYNVSPDHTPLMEVMVNDNTVRKTAAQFIVEVINEVHQLKQVVKSQNEEMGRLREQLNNHNHYSQAGSMGQQ